MVPKVNAVTILVDSKMKSNARNFAKLAVGDTYDRFNYNSKQRLEKIAWGKLGEETLAKYFASQDLFVDIDYNIYPGTSATDETDFIINNYKIDLKVGTQSFHRRLLVVKSYFDNGHQSDYYIAINFYDNANLGIIYGYATREEVSKAPVASWDKINPIEDYTLLYKELKPIQHLIELLKNHEK